MVIPPQSQTPDEPRPWPEQVMGTKYVRLLAKYLGQLHGDDKHGNRQLFLDDVFTIYLLAHFNPSVRSLRTIEDFSQCVAVQKYLMIPKICRSTLSDFNREADPEMLVPIVQKLSGECRNKQRNATVPDGELGVLLEHCVAVDGTFLPAMADVAWAVCNKNNHDAERHRARFDAHLNVASGLPEAIVVPDPGQSESDSAIAHLERNRIYIYDRGYLSFSLIRAHYEESESPADLATLDPCNERRDDAPVRQEWVVANERAGDESSGGPPRVKSHFVIRYKPAGGNSPALKDAVERPLTEADLAAGVTSDRVGAFNSTNARRAGVAEIPLREVLIEYEERGVQKTLRIITSLMNLSAAAIGILYRCRWQVELFFRWLKSYANVTHLICHTRNGMLMHIYVTMIGMLLTYLHGGSRPSKYLFSLLSLVAAGAATLEEVLPILRERERQSERARQSAAKRRAKKKEAGL